MRRLHLEGQKFNKWTVKTYAGQRGWFCECGGCGKIKKVTTQNLKNGSSKQCFDCACKLPKGEANFNDKLSNCKAGAKQRGLSWELTNEEAKALFQGNCFYCGIEPIQIWHHTETNGQFLNNGIDRQDSEKGYIKDNCVSCCKKCNYMKKTLSVDDFLSHIERILNHQKKVEAL